MLLPAAGLPGAVWLVTISTKNIWIGVIGALVCFALPVCRIVKILISHSESDLFEH
jgi:hypothetical protein